MKADKELNMIMIIFTFRLVLPVVTRQTVNIMNAGVNFTDTTDLSTFGFLYGTFPAAPGVFVIAAQYNLEVDLIASTMVASTFASAPLMFMSAKMIAIHDLSPSDYMNELDKFAFEISIVAIVASIYLLLLFTVSKKIKRMPHRITCCLILSQLLECVGVILWSTLGQQTGWRMILQFCFFTIGGYSSRLWTAILAITILFLQCRSLCFVLKLWPVFMGVGWGLPTFVAALLLIFDPTNNVPDKRNPSFQYGNAQAAVSVFILVMCFIVIIGCLILHQRYKRIQEKYHTLAKEVASSDSGKKIYQIVLTISMMDHINCGKNYLFCMNSLYHCHRFIEYLPTASTSTTNLIGHSASSINGSIPHVSSENNVGFRRRFDIERDTESSDDDVRLVKRTGCGGSSGGVNGDCCSAKSPIKTVVDIEDILARKSINNDPDVDK